MCAIIGVYAENTPFNLEILKRLFKESQIRGKHATGISWLNGEKIETIKSPIQSSKFIEQFDFNSLPKELRVIGHCRYSTSDLEFNQPIQYNGISIAHNGVITQEDPSKWKEHFGYDCVTRNDSELILRSIENSSLPITKFDTSSIAAIRLQKDVFEWFRNGKRPLWYFELEGDFFIASTKNILERVFEGDLGFNKCEAGDTYKIFNKEVEVHVGVKLNDLQNNLTCSKYYKRVDDGL